MRTRKEMEDIIRSGRSVYGRDGKLYSELGSLPSEATIALGNEEAENAAKTSIEREMKRLESELEMLSTSKTKQVKETETKETTASSQDATDKKAEDAKSGKTGKTTDK